MKQAIAVLMSLACYHLPALVEGPCAHILTEGQLQAVDSAKGLGNSYEIFTREVDGRTKVVALIGERAHLAGLTRVWSHLHDRFDRVAFSFRCKMDLRDRLFEKLSGPVVTAILKFGAYLEPTERAEYTDLLPHVRAFFTNEKHSVDVDPSKMPFTAQSDLMNNPYLEVHDDKVYEINRIELPAYMTTVHERGEEVPTINLERGFKPNFADRLRNHVFSINAALFTGVAATHFAGPAIESPAAMAWLGVFVWQLGAYTLHGHNAKAWCRLIFPFVYVGDDRRNAVAVPNILTALDSPDVNALAVVVERRRVRNLRKRLVSLGFTSVGGEPADRFPPRR